MCACAIADVSAMKGGVLPVLRDTRPLKKWLTYMHAPGRCLFLFILPHIGYRSSDMSLF